MSGFLWIIPPLISDSRRDAEASRPGSSAEARRITVRSGSCGWHPGLLRSSGTDRIALRGWRRPQPQWSQLRTAELAPFRLTSEPSKSPPLAVDGSSPSESLAALRSHAIRCPYGSPQTLPPAFGTSALVAPTLSLCLPLRLPPPPPGGPGGGSGSLRSCRETESPLLLRESSLVPQPRLSRRRYGRLRSVSVDLTSFDIPATGGRKRFALVGEPRADAPGPSPRFLTDAGATARNRQPRLPELHSSARILRPFASLSGQTRSAVASRKRPRQVRCRRISVP